VPGAETQSLSFQAVVKNMPRGALDMFAAGIIMLALLAGDDIGSESQRDTRAIVVLLEELMTDTSKYKTHRQRLARFVGFLNELGYYGYTSPHSLSRDDTYHR
jgi:hypothetical protein